MATTFQIIGHKKSGKTTLIENFLTMTNYKYSVVKHTHLPIDIPTNTDTGKFFKNSDNVLLLNDEQTIHYQRNLPSNELKKIEDMQKKTLADFIIIEGIKELDFPKIVLLKQDETKNDFKNISNIKEYVSIQQNSLALDIEDLNKRESFINQFLRNITNDR
ncbi:molybdopterin-guanine dinucleotide biosynthesis protein MobB [Companilactobacillus tucceti DSM 20183]|uniref:Molybdopterin-guanine dinucleotide biosynthesis protein MobB n=1 Tax=Companilactobacillus tucceti DSM 20183 TaxID=1423811 RepID=A0A0R1J342_9LACO|nr:molybdopterin-guanine dinucleotide biosynthesis protein B [Companilactobacillus tucceti]KRK65734.1 molybdopterin-guanine dinucleotide biosynthesis protein MobB [Companilactobacillus tucceti DSM 20183]